MASKTFKVKRDDGPDIVAVGLPDDAAGRAFVNLRFGNGHSGEFHIILHMADACALAIALENAINHAEPRAVEAADIGLMDEAA